MYLSFAICVIIHDIILSAIAADGDVLIEENGGFYYDGRFASYQDVINHYNSHFKLNLTTSEKQQLAAFLKSL